MKKLYFILLCFVYTQFSFSDYPKYMPRDIPLFETIQAFVESDSVQKELIENLTNKTLTIDKASSNASFTIYRSKEDPKNNNNPSIYAVEFRKPIVSKTQRGMVILSISENKCISQKEVINHFGPAEPVPPRPGMVENLVMYLRYQRPNAEISFEYDASSARDCLLSVVLNFI